jgi:hypothetical protein
MGRLPLAWPSLALQARIILYTSFFRRAGLDLAIHETALGEHLCFQHGHVRAMAMASWRPSSYMNIRQTCLGLGCVSRHLEYRLITLLHIHFSHTLFTHTLHTYTLHTYTCRSMTPPACDDAVTCTMRCRECVWCVWRLASGVSGVSGVVCVWYRWCLWRSRPSPLGINGRHRATRLLLISRLGGATPCLCYP